MGLRDDTGLEHYLEVPAVDFGYDQQLSLKVFYPRRWKKILSLWDTEAREEFSGGSRAREFRRLGGLSDTHSGPGPVSRSRKEEQTQAAGSGAGTKPPLKEPRVCTAGLHLQGATAGHGVASSDPQEEPLGSSSPATSSSTPRPKLPGDAGQREEVPCLLWVMLHEAAPSF